MKLAKAVFMIILLIHIPTEGNGINSTPDQQFFRAALGTQLDTGSRTSIHPRVTGSDCTNYTILCY